MHIKLKSFARLRSKQRFRVRGRVQGKDAVTLKSRAYNGIKFKARQQPGI